ncbi:MAG: hypothetical protein LBF66_03315 [Holosporales bacterium]|jgi:FlaA1/EpsC-like NDP-sugar epimerase|nr:hypothetical protein [Holosporales bacterium]
MRKVEILILRINGAWGTRFKTLWINARNTVRRPSVAEDAEGDSDFSVKDFPVKRVRLSSHSKEPHLSSRPKVVGEWPEEPMISKEDSAEVAGATRKPESIVQQDILFLLDLPLIFFSPLLSAFIFELGISEFSSEFILKNMIVFSLTVESSFILFRSYIPSSLDFWRGCLIKLAIPLAISMIAYYSFTRLLSHFEEFSSLTLFASAVICGGLLIGHRYIAHALTRSDITSFSEAFRAIRVNILSTGNFFIGRLRQVFRTKSAANTREPGFNQNVLFADGNDLRARHEQNVMGVLLVGMFNDVESVLLSGERVFDNNLRPIAIITPDPLDFGKYVNDIPVIGTIDFLDECLSDETFKGVVIVEGSLAPSLAEQVEQCASSGLVSVLTLVKPRYVRRKMRS